MIPRALHSSLWLLGQEGLLREQCLPVPELEPLNEATRIAVIQRLVEPAKVSGNRRQRRANGA